MKKIGILVGLSILVLIGCGQKAEESKQEKETVQVQQKVDLSKETEEYKAFVEKEIDKLLLDTEKFAETLKKGDLKGAKAQYPLIRMAYERSEPIAESFGESDINIDFRLADFKEEFNKEEGWRGFHRIEKILWENKTTKGTEQYADQLVKDIKELRAKISTVEVTPDMMITGAVDLLNEVSTSKITGEEEIYSHTDLYDFKANIEGAEKIFEIFKNKLETVDKSLVETLNKEFAAVNELLDKYKIDDKNYKLYTELTKEDTKVLAEVVTKLGEPLSQIGIVLNAK